MCFEFSPRLGFDQGVYARSLFVRYWLPVLVCAALIFTGSTDLLSTRRTSRFIGPVLRWFKPDISAESISRIQTFVRKTGHVTEYALLSMLLWRALRRPRRDDPRPWQWREAFLAVGLAAAYAITDEWHQSFVSSRYASAMDVLVDTLGAIAGVWLIWVVGRLRRRW